MCINIYSHTYVERYNVYLCIDIYTKICIHVFPILFLLKALANTDFGIYAYV